MSRLLQSNWVVMVLGMVLYLAVTAVLLPPAKIFARVHPPSAATGHTRGASWDFFNPELDRLMEELTKERKAVAAREEQLNELSTRLDAERTELNIVLQSMQRTQKEFDRNIVRVRDEESANLKKLAKVYANMSPEGAATIIKQMEDDQIVKFMVFMKENESAPLLETFAKLGEAEAKRAAAVTERLRRAIFRNPSSKP